MNVEKADIFTLAKFGTLDQFKSKFEPDQINSLGLISGLLHYSISGLKYDIANYLLDVGIDVNIVNNDGQTAQFSACINPDVNLCDKLIQAGVELNHRDKYGNNALWTAVFNCRGKNYQVVELLMSSGANPNNMNNAGRSPLDFAKQIGDDRLMDMLRL